MTAGAGARKLVLTIHVTASLGWLGAICAFMALAVTGLTSDDKALVRATYLAAEPVTRYVIVPMALVSLGSGIVQSLVTRWGLLRHYWVVVKLIVTVFAATVLLLYTQTVERFAGLAADPGTSLERLRAPSFVLHAAIATALLAGTTVLGVYKPRGRTRYGWRRQREETRRTGDA